MVHMTGVPGHQDMEQRQTRARNLRPPDLGFQDMDSSPGGGGEGVIPSYRPALVDMYVHSAAQYIWTLCVLTLRKQRPASADACNLTGRGPWKQMIRGWLGRRVVRSKREGLRRHRRAAVEAFWYVDVLGAMDRSIARFVKVRQPTAAVASVELRLRSRPS